VEPPPLPVTSQPVKQNYQVGEGLELLLALAYGTRDTLLCPRCVPGLLEILRFPARF